MNANIFLYIYKKREKRDSENDYDGNEKFKESLKFNLIIKI